MIARRSQAPGFSEVLPRAAEEFSSTEDLDPAVPVAAALAPEAGAVELQAASRNTFYEVVLDEATLAFLARPRSKSDPCIHTLPNEETSVELANATGREGDIVDMSVFYASAGLAGPCDTEVLLSVAAGTYPSWA